MTLLQCHNARGGFCQLFERHPLLICSPAVQCEPGGRWGLVQHYEAADSKPPFCCSCCKHHCEHVNGLGDVGQLGTSGSMSPEELEALLRQSLDMSTLKRRCSCLSSQPIPDTTDAHEPADAAAAVLVRQRMRGEVAVPAVLEEPPGPSCPRCSATDSDQHALWERHEASCVVFGLNSYSPATCVTWVCSQCGHRQHYDGNHDCILNQMGGYKFCWEVLYGYSREMVSGKGRTFHAFW
jgi:hypothetical protein